jgi:protein-S-isoprenylcysteine O-methyltransferase Ste14
LAIKGVLFGGGTAVSSANIVPFAITVIVIFVLLFLLDKILQAAGSWGIPGWILEIVRYVIFAVVLIALLVMLDKTFLGGKYSAGIDFGGTPSIMKPERR